MVVACAVAAAEPETLYLCVADGTLQMVYDNFRGCAARLHRALIEASDSPG
jgi:hypothetical protein